MSANPVKSSHQWQVLAVNTQSQSEANKQFAARQVALLQDEADFDPLS